MGSTFSFQLPPHVHVDGVQMQKSSVQSRVAHLSPPCNAFSGHHPLDGSLQWIDTWIIGPVGSGIFASKYEGLRLTASYPSLWSCFLHPSLLFKFWPTLHSMSSQWQACETLFGFPKLVPNSHHKHKSHFTEISLTLSEMVVVRTFFRGIGSSKITAGKMHNFSYTRGASVNHQKHSHTEILINKQGVKVTHQHEVLQRLR